MMFLQIPLFLTWAFCNIGAKPSFGDATEYFNLSKDLVLDEYRPVLYPLVIRLARWLGETCLMPYQFYVYCLQAAVSYCCLLFAVCVASAAMDGGSGARRPTRRHYFLAAYLWSFPMIGFMNFAGMSDSIALSATVVFLCGLFAVYAGARVTWRTALPLAGSFAIGSLVRGDRLFLFSFFAAVSGVPVLLLRREKRRETLRALAVVALSALAVAGVNRATQKPGCHGRPRTTFSFVLLDRIVWPHMRECYYDFPLEVRQVVSIADSKKFDANNNNVMYVFAKKMNAAIGEEKAHQLYRTMAKTVFRARTKRVVGEIAHDIAKGFFAPFFQLADVYNLSCHANGECLNPYCYNPRCFATHTQRLTWFHNAWSLHLFALSFAAAVVLAVWRPVRIPRKGMAFLLVFFGFSATLVSFYGLGDGAHPNSRYSIIVDTSWCFALFFLLGLLPSSRKAGCPPGSGGAGMADAP